MLAELAVIAYAAVLVASGWWVSRADREWRTRLAARGLMPEFEAGGLAERAEDSLRAGLRYLAAAPRIIGRDLELSSRVDDDHATEVWRMRSGRRLRLVLIVALVGLTLPAAAAVLPVWVASLPSGAPSVAALFVVGVLAISAVLTVRFVRGAIEYGNGEDVTLGRLLAPAGGNAVLLLLLAGWAVFR